MGSSIATTRPPVDCRRAANEVSEFAYAAMLHEWQSEARMEHLPDVSRLCVHPWPSLSHRGALRSAMCVAECDRPCCGLFGTRFGACAYACVTR